MRTSESCGAAARQISVFERKWTGGYRRAMRIRQTRDFFDLELSSLTKGEIVPPNPMKVYGCRSRSPLDRLATWANVAFWVIRRHAGAFSECLFFN